MSISSHELAHMLLAEQDLPLSLELNESEFILLEKVELMPVSFLNEEEEYEPAREGLTIAFPGLRVDILEYEPDDN